MLRQTSEESEKKEQIVVGFCLFETKMFNRKTI